MNHKKEKTIYVALKQDKDSSECLEALTIINGYGDVLLNISKSEEFDEDRITEIIKSSLYVISYNAQPTMRHICDCIDKSTAERLYESMRRLGNDYPDFMDEDDDEENIPKEEPITALNCMMNFSITYGEYARNGKIKRQTIQKALEYYGISIPSESETLSPYEECIACKQIWESIFPFFYEK